MSNLLQYLEGDYKLIPAVVCYLVKDGKVLLGVRKKVSLGLGLNLIAGIGGKVRDTLENSTESDGEGAKREILEEINVNATRLQLMGRARFVAPHNAKWSMDVNIYLVEEWEGDPQETEAIQPLWFEITNLPTDRMWDDNRHWVHLVLSGQKVDMAFMLNDDSKVVEHLVF